MNQDPTVVAFDRFYNLQFGVDGSDYDVVFSFFRQYCSTDSIAQNFTQNLFRIAQITDRPATELLSEFEGLDSMNITLTMSYYLNTYGDKTVMFGISVLPAPTLAVARNVVQ